MVSAPPASSRDLSPVTAEAATDDDLVVDWASWPGLSSDGWSPEDMMIVPVFSSGRLGGSKYAEPQPP